MIEFFLFVLAWLSFHLPLVPLSAFHLLSLPVRLYFWELHFEGAFWSEKAKRRKCEAKEALSEEEIATRHGQGAGGAYCEPEVLSGNTGGGTTDRLIHTQKMLLIGIFATFARGLEPESCNEEKRFPMPSPSSPSAVPSARHKMFDVSWRGFH